ncbi:hypothetical protein LENED_011988 [Lentinula edodes]|uniref:Uncharacterized protein n=1 Tax=Lentinula edodes TaxID=5353 RepID=A0A1Q3ERG8_LENED|nr:hypothetical protein LENED_011988 [Lentinula edodes]
MKEYLGNHELYFDACLRALEENIDLRVKMAVAAEIDKLQKGEGAEPEDDDSDKDELEDDEVEKKKEVKREGLTSHAASNSNLIKALITVMFKLFLGVDSLTTRENLLGASVPNGDELPLIPGTDVHQIHFDWENTAKKSENGAKLETIAEFAKTHGHDYKSGVKELLDIIQLGDLKSRVETKFNSLRGIYRRALTEDINMKKESSGTKANRAKGKLEARIRKRNNLPEDNEYKNMKYNTAMVIQMQSDDEKDPAEPKKFISRAATWRSQELQEFFDAVDTQPDPKGSSQYIPQVCGQAKEMPLPATKQLEGRARRWMVSTEWLNDHPEFDTPNRLADNSRLWGDAKDPEDLERLEAENKKAKKEIKEGKRKVLDDSDVESNRKKKKDNKNQKSRK